jgi:hypothetical protein
MNLIRHMHPPGWIGWNVINIYFARLWGIGAAIGGADPYVSTP